MPAGLVLVHGFSGSPDDLLRLHRAFVSVYGPDSVSSVCLPGHGHGLIPPFDEAAFISSISDPLQRFKKEGRKLVVFGHSTGGILALSALREHRINPDLLVLASVPKLIDANYLERWRNHRSGKSHISFSSVAHMISLIKATGADTFDGSFPVLVLHGELDELVPSSAARAWEQGVFNGPIRTVVIPGAGHDLFRSGNNPLAVDVIQRAVADILSVPRAEDADTLTELCSVEPEAKRFLLFSPSSSRHLAASPSGRAVADRKPNLTPEAVCDPIIANIEITTRCNLRCAYCARTIRGSKGEDMPLETFKTILGLLPHAYRITLVGLGETLLHPRVADFIAEASSLGRRVALVTNAMLLDEPMSRNLLEAGLESIAFSIDGSNQGLASEVRPGTDLEKVIHNIKRFVQLSKTTREISTAVFSAVSTTTIASLEQLVDVVAGLGVHVMMLSDLNFRENLDKTLWKNSDSETAARVRSAVARAFQKNLPLLTVRGLEEFGLWKRYGKFLLVPSEQLYQRSTRHAWCFSPWQTVPINVRGDVTLCDCQPESSAGNLLIQPLSEIWSGEVFARHRRSMVSDKPPEACMICPRF